MNIKFKNIIRLLVFIGLVIPIGFGYNVEYFFFRYFNLYIIFLLIIGTSLLFFSAFLIVRYLFNISNLENIKNHELIATLINKNDDITLWLWFPLTMIIEELIFRFYVLGILLDLCLINYAILISSVIFSLYHLHTWFAYKNYKILITYLIFSFFLGLFNGLIFFFLGLFPCIAIHYFIAFYMYYALFRKYSTTRIDKKTKT
ncbi:MAG: CPBP family intramembrane metalloprotease [Candidatus Lokiarchaeota archaeon]|nr:CPBP family intramembrane metalloprotease [Candidatus Lokiarchaeota archaeon]MBD3343252.1 CPBP family intramembrane metalloprotease [Candidatus Lokiarchaeota archaeon]